MEANFRKQDLLRKYLDNKCSSSEMKELFDYLKSDDDESYEGVMRDLWNRITAERKLEKRKADRLLEKAVRAKKPVMLPLPVWYRLAAAVLALAIATGGIFLLSHKHKQTPAIAKNTANLYKNDIKPGGPQAILQVGNTQVTLNKSDTSFTLAGNVVHVNSGNIKIADVKPVNYTLIVPRGGEYSLVLSDGTKVWLNADSKLTYPSLFNNADREVSLEGEAYFEVEKDGSHPFIVHTKEQTIKVLGTEFNVHAYPDGGNCITTLVKGKVQVNSFSEEMVLNPDQQAISNNNGKFSLQKNADVKEAIAWKNGYFQFDNTDLHEIMRQLSRWYNVKVTYENGVKPNEFMAIVNRNNNISQILNILEETGVVHFQITGNEVTVMP